MIHKKIDNKWQRVNVPLKHKISGTYVNLSKMPDLWEGEGYFDVDVPKITEYQELIELTDNDVKVLKVQRVRDFDQSEIDIIEEDKAENLAYQELETKRFDGMEACKKLRTYLKRNLNEANFKASRILVKPVFQTLMNGDWDIALDEITEIDNANSTAVSQKIKTRIETYLNN